MRHEIGPAEHIRRPLPHLDIVIWIAALLTAAMVLFGQVERFGELKDRSILGADNGLRLQEVRDLVAGQAWYDLDQHRYGPPNGTLMHWSRLVDAPIAGAILALRPILGSDRAERVAMTLWPALLLVLYAGVVVATLTASAGARAAALAIVLLPQLITTRDLFAAGALDHHNVQALLVMLSALPFVFPERRAVVVGGGVAAGLSLAVGLETLPFLAVAGLLVATDWIADPRRARTFALFGGSLALTSLAAFAAQTDPARWAVPECDALAPPILLLAVGSGALALILAAATPRLGTPRMRTLAIAAGGAVLLASFAVLFPDCLGGPYHAVPAEYRAAWLELTGEAMPLSNLAATRPQLAAIIFGPVLAGTLLAWLGVGMTDGSTRRLMLVAALMLTLTLALSMAQIRAVYVGAFFVPVAGGWALARVSAPLRLPGGQRTRIAAIVIAAFLFELPWSVVGDAGARFVPPLPAHPNAAEMSACLSEAVALDALPQGTILAPINLGAHILFLTRQSIVSAGYHRNVGGILTGLIAFAGDATTLADAVSRSRADYVVLCRPWIARHPERYSAFAQALAEGAASPRWLQPVSVEAPSLRVWRVDPSALPAH